MNLKTILQQLARYNEGEYLEQHEEEWNPSQHKFTISIIIPRTSFMYTALLDREETVDHLQERVRYEMVWMILQKGVEYVNEKNDIFNLFNPDQTIL